MLSLTRFSWIAAIIKELFYVKKECTQRHVLHIVAIMLQIMYVSLFACVRNNNGACALYVCFVCTKIETRCGWDQLCPTRDSNLRFSGYTSGTLTNELCVSATICIERVPKLVVWIQLLPQLMFFVNGVSMPLS